jgi:hypothetical protein
MPQYLLLIYTPVEGGPPPEELQAEFPKWGAYTQALQDAGVFVAGDALEGIDTATSVRVRDGETVVTDGPFADTKEALGGYYAIEVPDLNAALEWAARIPSAPYGSVEVRPVMVFDMSSASAPDQAAAQAS